MKSAGSGVAAFLRGAIGTILLATAVGKFLDIPGFARILGQYQTFPERALFPLAVAIPAVELAVGLWLFSGRNLVGAALVSTAMHLTYAAWSAISVLRGLRLPNCGCFGVFLARPLTWATVIEDLTLAGASAALFVLALRRA